MNPRVTKVIPEAEFTLLLQFENNESRRFDMRPYLDMGVFRELRDPRLFRTARVQNGTVTWIHHQDLCPDTLYLKSLSV